MRWRRRAHTVSAEMTIVNSTDAPLRLIVEPWAREYEVPARDGMKVTLAGPDKADMEIHVGPAGITVYGWVGSTLDDHVNALGARVPQTPRRSS